MDVDKVIRAFENWPKAKDFRYACPPPSGLLRRTVNPPPPPPTIQVILVYGSIYEMIHKIVPSLAGHLGNWGILNISDLLYTLNKLPHDHPAKKDVLCNMDRYALEECSVRKLNPSPQLLIDIVKCQIDEHVAVGHRKFMIYGLPSGAGPLHWFREKIAEPNAIIILQDPEPLPWHAQVKDYYRVGRKTDKVLIVPVVENSTVKTYERLLSALRQRIQASMRATKPAGEMAVAHVPENHATATTDTSTPPAKGPQIDRTDTPMVDGGDEDPMDTGQDALGSK
ncbi:hypothetical protein CLAFUW4_10000 [Fulvia fulva]|uniref:Uncharacterized protein n=1 Tax=Passalora fulva TaxID=5499 RepID=A0A9Q8PHF3_PASFU|nr:uncharacterized protein CLAFUR5_12245 [Fulvia fulva]KAK4616216.1 hypothetical protein CLAFUR4_10004 [Fulvia fulva]KAK4616908.1 hypothetical protein CLAFUR0_10001 [Fulvia fulva]UJO22489.1 hypothetical protein CLAFUR5_12245 [Fulvia fulva]WPV18887.1 hypothetical protein CLAFUW4_10000 [Fulvia fulva]WPV34592.1 hypothetical protein CLAFUW7_10001 [Fulvia fulva]